MSDGDSAVQQPQQSQEQQVLQLRKIYLKDLSLETPLSPGIFSQEWKPEFNLQINTASTATDEDTHEVVLTLTISAKQEGQTGFLIEIQQAGLFLLKGFSREQLKPILGVFCPNTLFPYARESIDSLLVKSGFAPLQLNPINFDALYQQHLKAQQEQSSAAQH